MIIAAIIIIIEIFRSYAQNAVFYVQKEDQVAWIGEGGLGPLIAPRFVFDVFICRTNCPVPHPTQIPSYHIKFARPKKL